jgi:3-oxoacyl-[acyl-carrier protein] reductase
MSAKRLGGEVALVTGGNRGIGEGIVRRLAEEGARVVFTGRALDAGARVEELVRASGGDALFVRADIAEPDDVRRAVDLAVSSYGSLTVLVNNATPSDMLRKGGGDAPVADISLAAYRRIMAVGFDGMVWACKYAIPPMRAAGHGSIVNISSAVSTNGTEGLFAYTAAKGAMNAVTRQMAVDYGREGIRCNTIVVGPVDKPGEGQNATAYDDPAVRSAFEQLLCVNRLGQPSDIANATVYLASREAEFVTGATLPVDGGLTARQAMPNITKVDV